MVSEKTLSTKEMGRSGNFEFNEGEFTLQCWQHLDIAQWRYLTSGFRIYRTGAHV